jgi:hypothetical protein
VENGVSEIRLLEILPAPIGGPVPGMAPFAATPPTDAPLHVRLIRVRLQKDMPYRQQYSALSYTWGDPNDRVPVVCNDMAMQITRSLHGALTALRSRRALQALQAWQAGVSGQPNLYWTDALCIDQANKTEKGQQIPLMRQIYSSAKQVLVWLGENARDSDMAFPIIPQLAAASASPFILSQIDPSKGEWARPLGLNMPQ